MLCNFCKLPLLLRLLQGKLWVAQHLNSNGVVQHDCYLKAPL